MDGLKITFNLTKVIVSTILRDRLKDTGSKYSTTHTYVSKDDVEIIVELRKKNISLDIIHGKLNLPRALISSILKNELGNKYKQYYAKNIVQRPFSIIYNKIISEIQPKRSVIV